jgi:lipoic acid synthetase
LYPFSCSFCAVATGRPLAVDTDEPNRVANSVKLMQVKHCVITSVDRDDLKDGGSIIWAETINAIRRESPILHWKLYCPILGELG